MLTDVYMFSSVLQGMGTYLRADPHGINGFKSLVTLPNLDIASPDLAVVLLAPS